MSDSNRTSGAPEKSGDTKKDDMDVKKDNVEKMDIEKDDVPVKTKDTVVPATNAEKPSTDTTNKVGETKAPLTTTSAEPIAQNTQNTTSMSDTSKKDPHKNASDDKKGKTLPQTAIADTTTGAGQNNTQAAKSTAASSRNTSVTKPTVNSKRAPQPSPGSKASTALSTGSKASAVVSSNPLYERYIRPHSSSASLNHEEQIKLAAKKLISKDASIEQVRKIVTDLRERIEIVHTQEYSNFLRHLFPAFKYILEKRIKPQIHFASKKKIHPREGKVLNQVRRVVLEILDRLPLNQAWGPYADSLLTLSINTLIIDNQDNALLCLKIIFSIFKYHNANRSEKVSQETKQNIEKFLKFTQKLYKDLRSTLNYTFLQRANGRLVNTPEDNQFLKTLGLPSQLSFKVVTECPKIVMLIFKSHTRLIPGYVPQFIPKMLEAVSLKVSPESFTDIRLYTPRLAEMIACQVKTLSFLTYLLKGFASKMKDHMTRLADAVVHLFKNCPTEAVDTRRELLVATRHILVTDFKKAFFPYVNVLLQEKTLLGSGRVQT